MVFHWNAGVENIAEECEWKNPVSRIETSQKIGLNHVEQREDAFQGQSSSDEWVGGEQKFKVQPWDHIHDKLSEK